jgi:hypothetical protein
MVSCLWSTNDKPWQQQTERVSGLHRGAWNRRLRRATRAGVSFDGSVDTSSNSATRHAANPRVRTNGSAQLVVPSEDLPIGVRPWSLIVLPDTQYYAASYPEVFAAQTQWIVDNRERLNIQIVMQAGDIVDTWNDAAQWNVADKSLSQIIDANIPYTPDQRLW